MTAEQIIDRLDAENIPTEQLVNQPRPHWLGKLECVHREQTPQTDDQLEHLTLVYRLADHGGIHLKVMATKEEDGHWDYWHLSECHPVQTTRYE